MSYRKKESLPIGETRFTIGIVGGMSYWVNIALDHQSGKITNGYLMGLSDHQLERMAYADMKNRDRIKTEQYIRPAGVGDQGGTPGEKYFGVHRAWIILAYRRAERIEKNKAEALKNEEMATAGAR